MIINNQKILSPSEYEMFNKGVSIEEADNFLNNQSKKIILPKYKSPVVSILILTYNKYEYTYQCLLSLQLLKEIAFEVILIDNNSTDKTLELLDKVENIRVVKNKKNVFYGPGCNQAAELAQGKHLLFLNNDTQVTPYLLKNLYNKIEESPEIGAVGAKTIFPNNTLQEAGCIVWRNGIAKGYGRDKNPWHYEYNFTREVDFCSAACLLVVKSVFEQTSKFDDLFLPAYYEDVDLCEQINQLGYKVIYNPNAVFFHFEYTSSAPEKVIKLLEKNSEKLRVKWEHKFQSKLAEDTKNDLRGRFRNNHKKNILFIDSRIPVCSSGVGYPRTYEMLKVLLSLGYHVSHYPLKQNIVDKSIWSKSIDLLQDLGLEVVISEEGIESFCKNRSSYYDLIFISRVTSFVTVQGYLEKYFKGIPTIFDSESLFSERERLKKDYISSENTRVEIVESEKKSFQSASLSITVTEIEKKKVITNYNLKDEQIEVLGFAKKEDFSELQYEERNDFLFVGSFLEGSPNNSEIVYFINEIWPQVQSETKAKLHIVGSHMSDKIKDMMSDSVIVHGYVEDLSKIYKESRVFVIPHRYAAGFPLKMSESLSYALPLVISKTIADQFGFTNEDVCLIGENKESFAKKCIDLYLNEKSWKTQREVAKKYFLRTHDLRKFTKKLEKIIQKVL